MRFGPSLRLLCVVFFLVWGTVYRGLDVQEQHLANIESGTSSELLDVQVIMTDDFQQETVNLVFILYDAVQRLI